MKLRPDLITSLLLLGLAAQAADLGPQHASFTTRQGIPAAPTHKTNTQLFPFLTKLRDATVEFFFGRHPAKAKATSHNLMRDSLRSRHTNELVLRFNITTPVEEAALAEAAARLFLDVWAFTEDFVDVRLHADEVAPLMGLLPKTLQTSHSTLISDLASAVFRSLPSTDKPELTDLDGSAWMMRESSNTADNLFFQDYQPLPVIIRWMRLLEVMFPSYVKYITVGKSFEGRDIPGLRVGVPVPIDTNTPRKTIVVTGGMHAREWISTSTVTYVAWSFITSFGKEPMITKLLDHFDIVFMPVVNPDGVEYTWQVDRLWRKSRQQTSLRFCHGIDLDHAFGFGWDKTESASDPCSESYGGEAPFQAVEAKQLAAWAHNETLHNVKFVGLLDLHSYSQQVLFPYTYTCAAEPPNLENLEELAAGIAKAIRLSNGESYSVASACEGAVAVTESSRNQPWPRIESGGGSAIDWFYHELDAHFSYQIKLRDTGSYGFLLPKEQIIPTGEEMFNAMKYFGDYLLGNNGIERAMFGSNDDAKENPDFNGRENVFPQQELRKRRVHKG